MNKIARFRCSYVDGMNEFVKMYTLPDRPQSDRWYEFVYCRDFIDGPTKGRKTPIMQHFAVVRAASQKKAKACLNTAMQGGDSWGYQYSATHEFHPKGCRPAFDIITYWKHT